MSKRDLRRELARRVQFVGCQRCGAVDRPLRKYMNRKFCPECLREVVPNLGTERSTQ